jgi:pimeloyl-ACP methyl ester carboxylesterase
MSEWSYSNGRFVPLAVGSCPGFVIEPHGDVDRRRRWIWTAPSWLAGPPPEAGGPVEHHFYVESVLARGFHVAGVEIGVSLGNAAGVASFQQLYEQLVEDFHLNPQARWVAQSNGGLMAYNWAARHADAVDRIFGIYPVCDLRTWPGLDKACGAAEWDRPPAFNMSPTELEARLGEFNPIEQLAPLAARRIPIFHIHGDADVLVPMEPNSGELGRRYQALGGPFELEVLPGVGHTPGPKFYESPRALAFLLED